MAAQSFTDLLVWRKAHSLVLVSYAESEGFPMTEQYGLTSQLRRAVVSVPANIAEGFKRQSDAEKIRFLNIAQASLEETRYYILLARDLNYSNNVSWEPHAEEVSRLLTSYKKSIERRVRR
ncbi:MAG: four helix bundle protein [Ignavibacteriae bacterium]|nr:four helix bundle protein [Ignavibacteriota bacterium]